MTYEKSLEIPQAFLLSIWAHFPSSLRRHASLPANLEQQLQLASRPLANQALSKIQRSECVLRPHERTNWRSLAEIR